MRTLAVSGRVEEKKKKGGEVGVGPSSPFRPSPPALTQAELVGPPSQPTNPSGPLTLSTFSFLTLTWHVGPAHQLHLDADTWDPAGLAVDPLTKSTLTS